MLKFAAKLVIAGLFLWYVFTSLDAAQIFAHLADHDPLYLGLAVICLLASTYISSLRLGIYLGLKRPESRRLYYSGMLFNTILPGGISGDGYIIFNLKKHHDMGYKKSVQLLLLNRANGLFFLNLFFFAFLLFSEYAQIPYVKEAVIGLFLLQLPVYFIISRKIFGESWQLFLKTSGYSIALQGFSILSAFFVFLALGADSYLIEYISQFIAASIASIVPVTPGGVGIREIVFYKGSKIIGLNAELAVAASLVYFGLYLMTSFIGFYYLFKGKKRYGNA